MRGSNTKIRAEIFTTLAEIIKFFVEHEQSDSMDIDLKSMKLLIKLYNNPNDDIDFYIGTQGLHAKNATIMIGLLEKDSSMNLETIVIESHPIIGFRIKGKEYIHYDIEARTFSRPDGYIDFDTKYTTSKAASKIQKHIRDSEDGIEKFNL